MCSLASRDFKLLFVTPHVADLDSKILWCSRAFRNKLDCYEATNTCHDPLSCSLVTGNVVDLFRALYMLIVAISSSESTFQTS